MKHPTFKGTFAVERSDFPANLNLRVCDGEPYYDDEGAEYSVFFYSKRGDAGAGKKAVTWIRLEVGPNGYTLTEDGIEVYARRTSGNPETGPRAI